MQITPSQHQGSECKSGFPFVAPQSHSIVYFSKLPCMYRAPVQQGLARRRHEPVVSRNDCRRMRSCKKEQGRHNASGQRVATLSLQAKLVYTLALFLDSSIVFSLISNFKHHSWLQLLECVCSA